MSDDSALREADQFIGLMREAIHSRFMNIETARELLRTVLKQKMWRHRIVLMTERRKDYEEFVKFVTDPPPEGLSTSLVMLETIAHGDIELEGLLTDAKKRPPGGDKRSESYRIIDNIVINGSGSPQGNSADRALRKLNADAPALYTRVLAGELSPHAAMVEAGFRHKTMTIPTDIEGAARTIARRFTIDEIDELIAILRGE